MIETLAEQPVALLFVVLAAGAALGGVRVKGVSLGPAGALFAGLALSAIDERLAVPEVVGTLGLALFTWSIGVSSGSVFFSSLRSQVRTLALVVVVLLLAAATAAGVGTLLDLSTGSTAGLFAGSLTNTPALAAAREALDGSIEPVVGYSVGYPIGVVAMILAAAFALRLGQRRPNAEDHFRPVSLDTATLLVHDGVDVTVDDLVSTTAYPVVLSRVERDGVQSVPESSTRLRAGDLVSVTGTRTDIDDLAARIGARQPDQLSYDRSQLDMRRIVVSDRRLTGQRLGDLDLHHRFGAVVTRVRRGDGDFLAHDDVRLLPGDRVRVVAPRERIREIAAVFGDSERRLGEVDPLGFTVGLALGLLVGLVTVPLGGGFEFALGAAGGPLVVGLVLGRLERTGPIVWQMPFGASLAIRQLGTIVFLGVVGSRSGGALADAMRSSLGLRLLLGAIVIVAVTAAVTIVVGRRIVRLGGARLAGTLAGVETQPAVLAFATEQTTDERVSAAYAMIFPLAMLVKIVLAQVLTYVL